MKSSLAIAVALHAGVFAYVTREGAQELFSQRHLVNVTMSPPQSKSHKTSASRPHAAAVPPDGTTEGMLPLQNAPSSAQTAVSVHSPSALADAITLIRARVEQNTHYPLALRRRGVTGRVELTLALSETGMIESVRVSKTSQSADLDQLALDAVQRSMPFDEAKKMGKLVLSLPIEFKLH